MKQREYYQPKAVFCPRDFHTSVLFLLSHNTLLLFNKEQHTLFLFLAIFSYASLVEKTHAFFVKTVFFLITFVSSFLMHVHSFKMSLY